MFDVRRATTAIPLVASLLAAPSAAHAAPTGRPLIPLLNAAAITARCDGELATLRRELKAMETRKGGSVLAELNALSLRSNDFASPVYLLQNVAPDKATRDAAQACLEKLVPFESELYQSTALYERVKAVKPGDAIDAVYQQDLFEKFEDAGATLPPDKRKRAKEILDELEKLGLAFQKNINEDGTTVTITPTEAAGMSEAWLAARRRDDQGNLLLGMDYPTILPFLEQATNGDARRRVWLAKSREGGQKNLKILEQALQLRYELAQLHGQPDYATYVLKRRMAQTPAAVYDFLGKVKAAAEPLQGKEFAELRAEKAKIDGTPLDATKLNRWDVAFLKERVRKARYSVDQEALRAYFPTETSVQYAMELAKRLYGVEFIARDVPVWHKDVRYYDVYDRLPDGKRGAFVGGIYLDLFPREGKYNHAAAFGVYSGSTLAHRTPVSALVANLDSRGLNQEELRTLLHEYGHVLHGVLSKARYADQSGTAVKRDFVEAPSQMFEEWARKEEPLALFATLCPTCPKLTREQIAQLDAARKFGLGNFFSRQGEYALYDMELHTGKPPEPMPPWIAIENADPLGYVEGSLFPAGFGHLLGGYAAGYYGYMWSQVLALDMLTAFDGKLMNPAVGRRYRETILSSGGQKPPQALVESFLGRKPNSDAFYAEINGTR
ncbi:MAG TPA: M3 family metallopeptidase [Burkholderiaceae bacterium]|nr:M3 family metallopeptidase [Burkholderiaceae bacterium]